MLISLFKQHIRVFVAEVSSDMQATKKKLCTVLKKAGIEVFSDSNSDETMKNCDCSVHILGKENIYDTIGSGYNSLAGKQYRNAKELRSKKFKMFVWNPAGNINETNFYINNIRRDIVENTVYSSKTSPIVFVEELRGIMSVKSNAEQNILERDIFFIYNDLDKDTATIILNMIEDIQTVVSLGITMNSNTDYTEYIKNQLPGCKIGVVYYDYAGDWAVSFARQIWKDTGGNSSRVPLFVIGNSAHAKEEDLKIFDSIMETSIREQSLIPLDIKVFFDKATASA